MVSGSQTSSFSCLSVSVTTNAQIGDMCARQWITSSARGPVCVSGDPITRAEGPGVIHCFADSAKEGCSAVDGRKCHRFSRPIQAILGRFLTWR